MNSHHSSRTGMYWSLILSVSMLGLLHGALSLFGIVQGWEMAIWITLGLLSITILILKVNSKIFLHGVMMGLGITLFTGVLQSVFLDTYLQANPDYAIGLDPNMNYALFIIGFIPVLGSIYGLLIGLLGLVIKRLLKARLGD